MSSNNPPYLHVYKASAGSGKTHQLTGQYIRLLFSAPHNYRHILAVTFTNKATDEMKSRIVEELNNLAVGNKSGYLTQLMEEFKLSEKIIRQQAKGILQSILHNYSTFSISTIDRFFQQTMRAFTREMGITGGYKVEVDNQSFLPEIVDLMLNELDEEGNEELIEWLLDYMKDRIEDSNSWKINQDIVNLASNLFDERFITLSAPVQDQIKNKQTLNQYKQKLWAIVRNYENQIKEIGLCAQGIAKKHNLEFTDFSGGSRSQFRRFDMWATGDVPDMTATFLKYPDDVSCWYTKKAPNELKNSIEAAFADGLNRCVKDVIGLYDNSIHYATAREILKLFNTLGILNDVNNRLQKYRRDTNMLFLSDTTELLNKIIADSESPFVYEKIGSRLNHFMIDEFQDTSTMQWNNFRPLLDESMASGNYNLIVGDVKQSIYRWRNSDWRLLEEQIVQDFTEPNIQQHVLETNWRSDANIVRFNNKFFEYAATTMQDEFVGTDEEIQNSAYFSTKIADAYSQVSQHISPHKLADDDGAVSIQFIDQEEVDSWQEEALNQLPLTLQQLQDDGFRLKDIAILVRTGKEAVAVSEALLLYKDEHPDTEYNYDFISNEALLLNNSSCVKTAVALLQYINSPLEKTGRVRAIYEYYRFATKMNASDIFDNYVQQHTEEFPEQLGEKLAPIISLPLYELAEALFDLLKEATQPTDTVYIQAFLDLINDYSARKTADLNGFLAWWDEAKEKKSLFSPANQDAIQLMTIHKSKGLEFGAVILPFASWNFEPQSGRNILWCKPEVAPFDEIGVVPVKYSDRLASTIFKQDYLEEKLYSYIDNLNLLYVTLTRPKHRLIITAPKPKPPKKNEAVRIKNVADLLWQSVSTQFKEVAKEIEDSPTEESKENHLLFSFGSPKPLERETKDKPVTEPTDMNWQSTPFRNRLKLRLSGIGYFSDDGTRDFGTLMHEIVSEMRTLDDLDSALEKKVLSGELTTDEKQTLHDFLSQSLSLPEVQDWYSGNYHVLNEQQVLHPSLHFIRPDRVMIKDNEVVVVDYKFGESVESKYVKQVQRYVKSIEDMGYANVRGYVFYVKLGKIIQV